MSPAAERHARRPRGDTSLGPDQIEAFERLLERFRPGHRPLLRLLFAEDMTIGEAAGFLGLTRAETLALYSAALAGFGQGDRPAPRPARAAFSLVDLDLFAPTGAAPCHSF